MARDPFPLQWPEGWKRSINRRGRGTMPGYAKFEARFARDRDSVLRQLRHRGTRAVITSNLPVRADGLPYANAPQHIADPGVAVYWVERGHERVIACDRWNTCALNLRAIDMSLEAIRGLDRWGATEMVERAFAGFAALPAGDGSEFVAAPPRVRTWREVLGVDVEPYTALERDDLLVVAKARHRKLIQDAHPDRGGDPALAAEINAAIAAAESELAR